MKSVQWLVWIAVVAVQPLGIEAQQQEGCFDYRYALEGTYRLEADLECDGSIEILRIEWVDDSGESRGRFTIESASGEQRHVWIDADPLPDIAGVADLDGDGVEEVVLVSVDAGTLYPVVVSAKGFVATFGDLESNRTANLVLGPEGMNACLNEGWPKFVRSGDGIAVELAYGNSLSVSCGEVRRVAFRLVGRQLRQVEAVAK